MKSTRKLIPALVMLLVSAVMLSTASFAWFASNPDVEATNMKVNVNSDVKFLEIATAVNGSYDDSVDIGDADATVLELVHPVIENDNSIEWSIGSSDDETSPNAGKELEPITLPLTNYAYSQEFWVKASDGSQALSDLVISSVEVVGTNALSNAIRVLVVGKDGLQIWSNRDGDLTAESDSVLISNITTAETDDQKLTAYIYFDGEDADAYTNKLNTTLGDLTIKIAFIAD